MQAKMVRFVLASLVFAVALVGCAGGSKKTVKMKGKLVFPANLKLVGDENVQMDFIPEAAADKAATANVDVKAGTFDVNSAGVKGVYPGKYKIAIQAQPYPGSPEGEKRKPLFEPINQAFSRENTKLTYEIPATPAEQSMTIDLGKGTATKD